MGPIRHEPEEIWCEGAIRREQVISSIARLLHLAAAAAAAAAAADSYSFPPPPVADTPL